jgi:hypothetical protein
MKWLFIVGATTHLCFSARDKKRNGATFKRTQQSAATSNHPRYGKDDGRIQHRFPEVPHSFKARLQNNCLFKLPTQFVR